MMMNQNDPNHLQTKQMNQLGVTIRSNNEPSAISSAPASASNSVLSNNSTTDIADIPMANNSRSSVIDRVLDRNSANPITSNIPWDERSASLADNDGDDDDDSMDLNMGIGVKGLRLAEAEFVSLQDVDGRTTRTRATRTRVTQPPPPPPPVKHYDFGLHNPLKYNNEDNTLRMSESEI